MRFVLDEMIDARCVTALQQLGHDAWTVTAAGRSGARDDDQLIYAMERDAVLITHDREFASRRSDHPIGRLIRLTCDEMTAAHLLTLMIPEVETVLARRPNVVVFLGWGPHDTGEFKVRYGTES